MMLTGVGVSPGTACARLYVARRMESGQGGVSESTAETPDWRARLDTALALARDELETVVIDLAARLGADEAAIFNAQLMILDDVEWRGEIERLVDAGTPAPVAVRAVSDEVAHEIQELHDEYLQARAADIRDVAGLVLRHLGVGAGLRFPTRADGEVVLAAAELTPSDTVGLDPTVVRAILTESGTRTSHAAILARQMGIPAVVRVGGLLAAAEDGRMCAVDGAAGTCEFDPDPDLADRFSTADAVVEVRTEKVETADGVQVSIYANAASAAEVELAMAHGADGVGLFRTELLLDDPRFLHDEERQVGAYSAAAAAARGKPIVFRTFDVGGDKPVPGLSVDREANPFMGLRGIRLCLDRSDVFQTQLRALSRVSAAYPNVDVMIPMVSGLEELDRVLGLVVDSCGDRTMRIGTMVEVPSAALLAQELARCCDFLSVGTNDLTAYVLAADRNNTRLDGLYNELHPGVLRLLSSVLDAGRDQQVKVSVCGELAGDLRALPLLIGMGLRTFSVASPLIPSLKKAVMQVDSRQAEDLARQVLTRPRVADVMSLLQAAAQ